MKEKQQIETQQLVDLWFSNFTSDWDSPAVLLR